ncbi:partial Toxin YjjJ, partial [Rhodocyclaceae bacterium]
LYAFGTLIGNTDMHHGNLSFVGEHGRPYSLAPAYDMLPMAFRPLATGALPDSPAPARLHPAVQAATWRRALALADEFNTRMHADNRFSPAWKPCADALVRHVEDARGKIARLG